MKTAIRSHPANATSSRKAFIAGSAAMLALAALAFAGQAEARDNVSLSIGIGVPGVQLGASSGYPAYPVYQQPVYVQPQVYHQQPAPVYYQQPRPVYIQPRHVYAQPQVIYQQPQPFYDERPHHRRHGGGYYMQGPRHGNGDGYGHGHGHGNGYKKGYARDAVPVYYVR